MEITHELMLDLQQTGVRQTIYAKRGDSLTRTAKIRLFDGGTEFTVPTGAILQIAYAKSDGKGGLYDTMPDNSAACTASGNIVTAKLHPQMFTVAGLTACELRLLNEDGEQISTFLWFVSVQSSATDGIKSEDYYNFATINGVKAEIGDLSKLNTSVKDSLVAAINEVFNSIPADYVKSVNNVRPMANGDLLLRAGDIDTQVATIGYQGTVEGAFDAIAAMPALPVARGVSSDRIAYTATDDVPGCVLPTVSAADSDAQISAVGKGQQIVFVPMLTNNTIAPTLQLNDGEIIPIRLRAPKNQGSNYQSPDATLPVPAGALMRGVPYTMTFCGKYWLVDSMVMPFTKYVSDMLELYASELNGLRDSDTIALPIINSLDGVAEDMATMFVKRSAAEDAVPDANGNVTVPTESRVTEMIDGSIPKSTDADSGKILTVSASGKPVWTDVVNAEEVAV